MGKSSSLAHRVNFSREGMDLDFIIIITIARIPIPRIRNIIPSNTATVISMI
jgi:hypothetical protein